ncbi:4-hydroxybenzoate polyprenyltransferase [Pedobacter sp. ok626]|uniref:UbiA family prenyltransferase n=1 Tax=Pedobacter sp. ok626 TaxID=1761882 RepID=UPI0008864CCE|nr:UbiA family prenyltransferase [Pedobacter sp. ok626]SDJ56350.1 4-hydroxybenzoate polyprenyltransferase [Pedobacter sp. ok626]
MAQSRLKQLTRSHEWWDHKTPQILSLAYATALMGHTPLYLLLGNAFLILFGSLVLIAVYASIINDVTDLEIDIACGKSNMMQRLSPALRLFLVLLSLGFVFLAAYFIYPRVYAVVFYLCIVLAISLYSFPPVRLKKRRVWGVISCATAEHMFPALFAVAIIFYFSNMEIEWKWMVATGLLSFCYGLRSILWHQFLDKENDERSGIDTFANGIDPKTFGLNEKVILLVEVITLAILLFQLNLWITYISLMLYAVFILWRQRQFKSKIIIIITPENKFFQILMLDFYTVFFPMSLLSYCAFTQPYGWVPLLVHTLLFYKILLMTFMDGYHLIRDGIKRIIR